MAESVFHLFGMTISICCRDCCCQLCGTCCGATPITSEYEEDLVLTGHTDAADEIPKKKLNKKQEDKKDWKDWRGALESDEDSTDPKAIKKCKDRLRKALKVTEFKKNRGTLYSSYVYSIVCVVCSCFVLFCIGGWARSTWHTRVFVQSLVVRGFLKFLLVL